MMLTMMEVDVVLPFATNLNLYCYYFFKLSQKRVKEVSTV
jgi:hypothetical protein